MSDTLRTLVVGLAALCFVAAGSARAFHVIDTFDAPDGGQSVVDTTDEGDAETDEEGIFPTSDVVGGVRYMSINKTGGGNDANDTAVLDASGLWNSIS